MSYVVIQQPNMEGRYSFRHVQLDHYYTLLEQNEGVRRVVDTDGEYTAYGKYILETLHTQKQMELDLAIARMEAANAEEKLDPKLVNLYDVISKMTEIEAQVVELQEQLDKTRKVADQAAFFVRPIGGGPRLELEKLDSDDAVIYPTKDRGITIAPDPDFEWAKRGV